MTLCIHGTFLNSFADNCVNCPYISYFRDCWCVTFVVCKSAPKVNVLCNPRRRGIVSTEICVINQLASPVSFWAHFCCMAVHVLNGDDALQSIADAARLGHFCFEVCIVYIFVCWAISVLTVCNNVARHEPINTRSVTADLWSHCFLIRPIRSRFQPLTKSIHCTAKGDEFATHFKLPLSL